MSRKEGNVTIVPIRDFAFERVLSENYYAYPESSNKRILDYMAFYRTKPVSGITHYAKVDSISEGEVDIQYQAICFGDKAHEDAQIVEFDWVKELDERIKTEKYGIQGTRITTKESLLSATSIDDIK
jgi:hypothetical protein